ncbi:hypothetical protein B0H19DRAFT_1090411 [Mycena capillaripes]|nr:hypothetical protein B0H19DRAFT_1090411 [Mycena capillaripes]
MYGQLHPFPLQHVPSRTSMIPHRNPLPRESRARGGTTQMPVAPALASRGQMPDIPTEIGLEIIELALIATSSSTLSAVSKKFNALVCKIIYKTVVLNRLSRIALFHRTVRSKSLEFLEAHVRCLAVTSTSYTPEARIQLEEIVAACTGLRTIAIPRPGILTSAAISATRPSELIIQKFDAMTPFEWDPLFDEAVDSPAARISQNITHLRICEPGAAWHSPLATLEFFGPLAGLTHLALARSVNPRRNPNDALFVAEVRTLLDTRPGLKMLVVNLFPARWPEPTLTTATLCSHNCLCKALIRVADKRLVVLATGWDSVMEQDAQWLSGFRPTFPPPANHGSSRLGSVSFWENWRMSDRRVVSPLFPMNSLRGTIFGKIG